MWTDLIFQSQTTCELFRIGVCDFRLQLDWTELLILHVFAYEHPDISPLYSQPLGSLREKREKQTPSQHLLDKRWHTSLETHKVSPHPETRHPHLARFRVSGMILCHQAQNTLEAFIILIFVKSFSLKILIKDFQLRILYFKRFFWLRRWSYFLYDFVKSSLFVKCSTYNL